ncbi:MAG: hypothetical protein AAF226_14405, partial [Verrucomicrobiota bacterium]
ILLTLRLNSIKSGFTVGVTLILTLLFVPTAKAELFEAAFESTDATTQKPSTLNWSVKPTARPERSALMLSSKDDIRFEGTGFYALTPGASGPAGMFTSQDETRAIIPLYSGIVGRSGNLKVIPLKMGITRLNVCLLERQADKTWKAVEFGNPLLLNSTAEAGTVRVLPLKREKALPPTRAFESKGGRWLLKDFGDRFIITSRETQRDLWRSAGSQAHFSPTGRFIIFNNPDGSQTVADAASGIVVSEAARHIHWANSDSLILRLDSAEDNSGSIVESLSRKILYQRKSAVASTPETLWSDWKIMVDYETNFIGNQAPKQKLEGRHLCGTDFSREQELQIDLPNHELPAAVVYTGSVTNTSKLSPSSFTGATPAAQQYVDLTELDTTISPANTAFLPTTHPHDTRWRMFAPDEMDPRALVDTLAPFGISFHLIRKRSSLPLATPETDHTQALKEIVASTGSPERILAMVKHSDPETPFQDSDFSGMLGSRYLAHRESFSNPDGSDPIWLVTMPEQSEDSTHATFLWAISKTGGRLKERLLNKHLAPTTQVIQKPAGIIDRNRNIILWANDFPTACVVNA